MMYHSGMMGILFDWFFTERFDLFVLYRRLLVLVIATYTIVRMIAGMRGFISWLAGPEKHQRLARNYLAVQLLRIRWQSFGSELVQIIGLLMVLGVLLYCHRFL